MEEIARFRNPVLDSETYRRREEEKLQLLLRYKYIADPEEMEYWATLTPSEEFKPIPESDEPFSTKFERFYSNPETTTEFIELEKYGYFLRLKK